MSSLSRWIKNQIEYNKLVRRIMVLWALVLSTYATFVVYNSLELVDGGVATAYSATLALLATVSKFYFDSRKIEDKLDE